MSKKKIIIIIVFVVAIIGFITYYGNKTTTESKTTDGNGNGTTYKPFQKDTTGSEDSKVDPQTVQTYEDYWYTSAAKSLYELFDGFTNDEEEEKIIKIISKCKTTQDIEILKQEYEMVDTKYTLEYRVYDDIACGGDGQLQKLNSALKKNGCTYQF